MELRSEDLDINLVRIKGLLWKPNLRIRVWSWRRFDNVLQEWRRARKPRSDAAL